MTNVHYLLKQAKHKNQNIQFNFTNTECFFKIRILIAYFMFLEMD